MPALNARDLTDFQWAIPNDLIPNHRAATTSADGPGEVGVASSTAFYGCSAPALLGLICPNVIPLTRRAIADSSNGCGQESCEVSSKL
jgi:hypothetical protein